MTHALEEHAKVKLRARLTNPMKRLGLARPAGEHWWKQVMRQLL